MNKNLLANRSKIIKAIIMLTLLTTFNNESKATTCHQLVKTTDSCTNTKMDNIEIKLLNSNTDYYTLSVSMNNESDGYTLSFMNGLNDILYSSNLSKHFSQKYALNKNDDFDGLKIRITNNKCKTSEYYNISFTSKVSDALLVMKS